MMALDNQPFSIVEYQGFKELIGYLQPRYKLPNKKFFTETMLTQEYERIYNKIKEEISEAELGWECFKTCFKTLA